MKKSVILGLVVLFGCVSLIAKGADMIEEGKTVSMDYVLTVDGEIVDQSPEGQPLSYEQGAGNIIPGLEKELAGLKVGDEKEVLVAPAEGYGEENPQAIIEFPKAQVDIGQDIQVGMVLTLNAPDGQQIPARVEEVGEETVKLNANHPLAGKTLNFKVKIVDIK